MRRTFSKPIEASALAVGLAGATYFGAHTLIERLSGGNVAAVEACARVLGSTSITYAQYQGACPNDKKDLATQATSLGPNGQTTITTELPTEQQFLSQNLAPAEDMDRRESDAAIAMSAALGVAVGGYVVYRSAKSGHYSAPQRQSVGNMDVLSAASESNHQSA